MWDAIKSDLFEFVSTVKQDTTRTVNKVLGDDDDEEIDHELIIQKKAIADLKRSYETYANPVKESNQKRFQSFLKKFDLSTAAKDIAGVLDEDPEVSRYYTELVPALMEPTEFWSR